MKKILKIIKNTILMYVFLISCSENVFSQQSFILAGDTIGEKQNIIYKNIEDLFIMGSYSLDINSDGINDFNFYASYYYGNSSTTKSCSVSSLNNNSISLTSPGSGDPKIHEINDQIGTTCYWGNNNYTLIYSYSNNVPPLGSGSSGIWWNVYDKYLGVRLVIGSQIFYGWIKLGIYSATSCFIILQEYAIQSSSQTIQSNKNNNTFEVYSNPSNEFIIVNLNDLSSDPNEYIIRIINTEGLIVKQNQIKSVTSSILIEDLSSGFYMIQLINKKTHELFQNKIIIQR